MTTEPDLASAVQDQELVRLPNGLTIPLSTIRAAVASARALFALVQEMDTLDAKLGVLIEDTVPLDEPELSRVEALLAQPPATTAKQPAEGSGPDPGMPGTFQPE